MKNNTRIGLSKEEVKSVERENNTESKGGYKKDSKHFKDSGKKNFGSSKKSSFGKGGSSKDSFGGGRDSFGKGSFGSSGKDSKKFDTTRERARQKKLQSGQKYYK